MVTGGHVQSSFCFSKYVTPGIFSHIFSVMSPLKAGRFMCILLKKLVSTEIITVQSIKSLGSLSLLQRRDLYSFIFKFHILHFPRSDWPCCISD